MEILSGANQPKDIVSKEYVDGQINNHVHDANEIPCNTKVLKLGSKEYKISENLQNALENLLDYIYMNASGVLDLQTNLKSVSDTVSKIPSYKGGTGISVAGDTIGHSNNTLPGMVGTGEILTPDFGDTVYTTWFSYDAQGHVTQSGTGGFVIPTVLTDDSLSDTSTNPLQNKTVKAKFDAVDSQISSLGIDNNNQWKKINSKADADHTHAYLPLAGGTMDDDSTIKLPYSNGRAATVKSNGIEFTMPTTNEGWASGLMFSKKDGTNRVGNIGAFGDKNELVYYFVGPVYNNPLIKILSTGQTTISSSAYPLILKRTTDGASCIKFENSNGALGWIGFDALDGSIKRWNGAATTLYSVLDTGNAFSTTVPKANGTASAGSANTASRSDHVHPPQKNAETWNGLIDDTMTANTTDTRLMVLNGNKVQHRQIDTLPFLSSKDLSQSVLFTSSSDVKTATIDNLFTDYSLVWCQFVGSKTTHTHVIPLAYLKSKKSLVFKDGDVPFNILYVSDTQIRWFDVQASGAETYTSVTIVKII